MSAHFELNVGQSANERSDGAILPVNTALGRFAGQEHPADQSSCSWVYGVARCCNALLA